MASTFYFFYADPDKRGDGVTQPKMSGGKNRNLKSCISPFHPPRTKTRMGGVRCPPPLSACHTPPRGDSTQWLTGFFLTRSVGYFEACRDVVRDSSGFVRLVRPSPEALFQCSPCGRRGENYDIFPCAFPLPCEQRRRVWFCPVFCGAVCTGIFSPRSVVK